MSKIGAAFRKWSEMSLVLRILGGLIIGAVLGLVAPSWTWLGVLGTVFVSALKAIAPVLVFVLVMASIAKAGGGLGARFRTVIALYLLSTLAAALVAVAGSKLFPVTLQLQQGAAGSAPGALGDIFTNLLTNMVANPVASQLYLNTLLGYSDWSRVETSRFAGDRAGCQRFRGCDHRRGKMDYPVRPVRNSGIGVYGSFAERTCYFHHLRQTCPIACWLYVVQRSFAEPFVVFHRNRTQPVSATLEVPC